MARKVRLSGKPTSDVVPSPFHNGVMKLERDLCGSMNDQRFTMVWIARSRWGFQRLEWNVADGHRGHGAVQRSNRTPKHAKGPITSATRTPWTAMLHMPTARVAWTRTMLQPKTWTRGKCRWQNGGAAATYLAEGSLRSRKICEVASRYRSARGRNTCLHQWNYPDINSDGDVDGSTAGGDSRSICPITQSFRTWTSSWPTWDRTPWWTSPSWRGSGSWSSREWMTSGWWS